MLVPGSGASAASGVEGKMSALQKIAEIEAEIARTQKNKATSFHIVSPLSVKVSLLRLLQIESILMNICAFCRER